MQAVLLSLPLLLFIVFSCCLKGSWSYFIYNVTWSSEGAARTNHIVTGLGNQIRFYCNNRKSDVFRTTSKEDYDNCNVNAYGYDIGTCVTVPVFVVTLIIDVNSHGITPYEVNTTYYYYSKYDSECANGVKLTVTVVNRTDTSIDTSIALPTTNTGTTTGAISTTGATGGNTGTTAGTIRTTAGTTGTTTVNVQATTDNVQVTTDNVQATTDNVQATTDNVQATPVSSATAKYAMYINTTTTTYTNASAYINTATPAISAAMTNTPTIGGSDDGNDSLLDKVSQYYYAPVIGVIILIVLVLLCVLTLFIVCYKRHTRKSISEEMLVKSISREVTDTDNEIHVQASTEERVELKETKNDNFVATYKRKDDSPGSVPHTNRPAPPPPPTTNSVKNAFNAESKMSSSVQSSSSRSVPATRSNGNNRVGPVASLPASSPRRQAPSAPLPPSSLGNSRRPPPPPYKK